MTNGEDGRAWTCVVSLEKTLLLGKVTCDLTSILRFAYYVPFLCLWQVLPLDQGLCSLGKGSQASAVLTISFYSS